MKERATEAAASPVGALQGAGAAGSPARAAPHAASEPRTGNRLRHRVTARALSALPLTAVLAVAVVFRFWRLTAVGLNSDEAVYTGTAASLAGDHTLAEMFPVFRAHPLLFQTLLSLVLRIHFTDWTARAVPAALGVAAVALTCALGSRLYGRWAGIVAALLLAVMPYHVTVSRQVLLDGTMTLCATATLYCVVRYAESPGPRWLLAAGGAMGATVLAKETSVILLGGLYAFFALTPAVRMRGRHLLLGLAVMGVVIAASPLSLALSGRSGTGGSYLLWQLFRRSNHSLDFYFRVVPPAVGPLLLVAAAAGLVGLRKESTWRERLLLCWVTVPVLFFTMWPVKGYQYLLPTAPVLAVLAGRALVRLSWRQGLPGGGGWRVRAGAGALVLAVAATLAVPAWARTAPAADGAFLAGTGGLPGGREAGVWVGAHVPEGTRLLAIGPSMGNVLQFYGHRPVQALSVSTDPRSRNPSYAPVPNPDRALRDGEFQYVVWDAYSARRTPFFTAKARQLIDRYHGRAVFTVRRPDGRPLIVVYQVRAA